MTHVPSRSRVALALTLLSLPACNGSDSTAGPLPGPNPGPDLGTGPAPGPTQAAYMGELVAVHPHSAPSGSVAVASDGALLVAGEGGALAFLDATAEAGMHAALKRVAIGDEGVLPVALAFDPDADPLADPTGDASVIYVAGGRSGLWAMRADPRPAEANRAVRIDDATLAAANAAQDSKRWCTDVGFLELGGARYVVALFAARDDSRLRLYPLEAARAALSVEDGTPSELAPAAEVVLARNPAWQPEAESFGYALCVDESDVYVALGFHGVVRARFDASTLSAEVEGGPVFGDASHYARVYDALLYDDYHLYSPSPQPDIIYDEPPVCLDVAVLRSGGSHHLFVVADELGWLRFDLTHAFSPEMPIDHQEGELVHTPQGERQAMLIVDDPIDGEPIDVATYARAVSVLETPAGPLLAVACIERPHGIEPGSSDEGRTLNHLGLSFRDSGHGVANLSPAPEGKYSYTLLYDLAGPLVPDACGFVALLRAGGRSVLATSTSEHELATLFGGGTARVVPSGLPGGEPAMRSHVTFAARFAWPPLHAEPEVLWLREERDRPGRSTYDVAHCAANPAVLLTGSNDAGLTPDGILVTCESAIETYFEPDPETGADRRGSNGIVFNPEARCLAEGFPGDELWWNVGVPPAGGAPHWRLARFHAGSDVCGATDDPPDLRRESYFASPPDRFDDVGRQYFSGGEIEPAYDAHVRRTPGREAWGIVCATRTGSPDGALMLRRDLLHAHAEALEDGAVIELEDVPGSILGVLETHPEYGRVDASHPDAHHFLRKLDEDGFVLSFFPELFALPDDAAGDGERWLLAVPAGALRLDPTHRVFTDPTNHPDNGGYHPEWAPAEPWASYHDHALVRIYDAGDPAQVSVRCTLVAPYARSAAWRIDTARVGERTYLFVADFGGRLFVYDASALAALPPGSVVTEPFADWSTPACVTDPLPNNVYGLAVDRSPTTPESELEVYLGVARVGVCVLRFAPGAGVGERLSLLTIVQTPGDAAGLTVRRGATAQDTTLLVADSQAGIRIFGRRPE